jgi:uncharacterized membrane protein YkvA (DUF1232 family)
VEERDSEIPSGLTRRLVNRLGECVDLASERDPASLLEEAENYLERVNQAHRRNRLVNYRLAEAIFEAARTVVQEWEQVPAAARPWMLGAIRYFAGPDDDEPDFHSPIGFEDDAEVLNTCLRLALRH